MQQNKKHIHLIGIGGIGISALAKIYLSQGYAVSGSDLQQSAITRELENLDAEIKIGPHSAENIFKLKTKPNLVIYSEAITKDNAEFLAAKKLGVTCLSGAEAIARFSKNYFTIAISGMHGKSTTASMIAQILIKAKMDPTFIIGTKPNARLGKSKYLVLEADEYKAKFLNYQPDILVLTNVEAEHLDYYKNLKNILKTFKKYLTQVKKLIITNKDDQNIQKIISSAKCKVKYFNTANDNKPLKLSVPGQHNQLNALAALETARALKIDDQISLQALKEYQGIWRRFEFKGKLKNGAILIDDYAHHPTEIKASLQACREKYPQKIIWAVFQPHQVLRTKLLFNQFIHSFKEADQVIITDIFEVAGRESLNKQNKVSGSLLARAIKKQQAKTQFIALKNLKNFIIKKAPKNSVVLIMGAGDIQEVLNQN